MIFVYDKNKTDKLLSDKVSTNNLKTINNEPLSKDGGGNLDLQEKIFSSYDLGNIFPGVPGYQIYIANNNGTWTLNFDGFNISNATSDKHIYIPFTGYKLKRTVYAVMYNNTKHLPFMTRCLYDNTRNSISVNFYGTADALSEGRIFGQIILL